VLTEVLSQAALRCADGKPFVLLGQSAGGLLAHAVAARLERDGVSPAGVALLDSFVPADMSPRMARALAHSSDLLLRSARYDDEAITAASVYTEMLRQWQARELGAPHPGRPAIRTSPGAAGASTADAGRVDDPVAAGPRRGRGSR
jgi:acetyl esterase/lipase